ncbi:MAG: serine/threonine-protein kinase PknK, partial [Polyangiales bacterium]
MGAVYKALDRSLRRTVAFKRLELQPEGTLRDRRRVLFEREYRTLVELAHPHIVAAYDYGTDADGPYYVMELLEGADMRELSPLPYPQACRYLREIAASLALLHARRLVHRDVTPRNVRVIEGGECKLLDFGLLAAFGDKGDASGTPPCIPPEALEGRPLDQRADLYSLGALAYFLLTGRQAYPATDALQLPTYWSRALEPPAKVLPAADKKGRPLPSLPRELDELVMRLLRLDSLARPTSAGAVMDRLDVILAGERDAARSPQDEMKLADSYLASSPFVGRTHERAFAKRAVAALQRGQGTALLLDGVAGIGKSRLLREIALEARLSGATVINVDAEAHDRPYATANAIGRKLLEVAPLLALEAAEAHAPVLGHVVPELRAALGGAGLAPRSQDPLQWRTQVQAALRGWFLELCRRRPVLLLVDNVQRCDHPSAVLIASLALEAKQHPLAVIATLRSGDDPVSPAALASLRHVMRQGKLGGLQATQVHAWVDSVFGDAPNLSRLSQFLYARGGGSPAHCMELLRSMVARGDIRYRDGTWVLPTEPSALALPGAGAEALRDRLEHLSGPARELARALSMHRGALSVADCLVLASDLVHEDGRFLAALCEELELCDVISASDGAYCFRHEALREALHSEVSEQRKLELHRRMAHAILARDP